MADNICPRADARRSPVNFLVSSMRPSMTSAATSVFDSGCRLTSKLPVALFICATSFGFGRFEIRVFDDPEHIAPGIEHVGDENALAYVLDLAARGGAELQQTGIHCLHVLDTPVGAISARSIAGCRSFR